MYVQINIMELGFEWDKEKNELLKEKRGVSFEEVVDII